MVAPIIAVEDLRFAYPAAVPGTEGPPVLNGVSFCVADGECLAIIGPTSAGKSTLCLALNGLIPHLVRGTFGGHVCVAGRSTTETAPGELSQIVGLVFQEPDSQFISMTVEDEVAFGLESMALPPAEIERRILEALEMSGIVPLRKRSPLELSGGEKQRVALAAVLAMRPRVLVLDEPTTSLDPEGKLRLLETVGRLRSEQGTTIVWVTQDVDRVPLLADRVAVLFEGEIALSGRPKEVFDQGAQLREMGLAVPQMRELADRFGGSRARVPGWLRVDEAARDLREWLNGRRGH